MKKLVLILLLALPFFVFSQTEFDNGYNKGYEKGYCLEEMGCLGTSIPFAPNPEIGFDSYQDGYNRGLIDGKAAKEGSSSSNSSSRRRQARGISTEDAALIGAASSSGNQPVDIGNAFMEGYNKSKAAADAARKEKLANMSPSKTETIVPLKVNLKNYSHIAIVGADYKSLYGSIQKELIDSPLTAINPKEFDKKKFRKDRRFLKSIKNPKWVYLYYKKVIQGYDEIRTVIVRDFQNNIIYHTKTTNISFNENLSPLVNF